MIVSYDLLYELEAVLMRPWFRRKLAFSDVVEYVMWVRERATFVPDAPPLKDWLVEQLSDPDDAYLMALAKEYRADYLITGDRGLLRAAGLLATATPDLPSLAVVPPQDFVQRALLPE
jgi:putative PIN family toxin of toxin-antitoxin system